MSIHSFDAVSEKLQLTVTRMKEKTLNLTVSVMLSIIIKIHRGCVITFTIQLIISNKELS